MGFRLEVVRRPVVPRLTRSERRSWQLHRRLSTLLSHQSFEHWRPTIQRNLDRLGGRVTGQPHDGILTAGGSWWTAATCPACTAC